MLSIRLLIMLGTLLLVDQCRSKHVAVMKNCVYKKHNFNISAFFQFCCVNNDSNWREGLHVYFEVVPF
jgi:hypothetical protein